MCALSLKLNHDFEIKWRTRPQSYWTNLESLRNKHSMLKQSQGCFFLASFQSWTVLLPNLHTLIKIWIDTCHEFKRRKYLKDVLNSHTSLYRVGIRSYPRVPHFQTEKFTHYRGITVLAWIESERLPQKFTPRCHTRHTKNIEPNLQRMLIVLQTMRISTWLRDAATKNFVTL